MTIVVGVEAQEWDILGRHFDEPGASFHKPTCQQASLAERSGVVRVKALLGFLLEFKRSSRKALSRTMVEEAEEDDEPSLTAPSGAGS